MLPFLIPLRAAAIAPTHAPLVLMRTTGAESPHLARKPNYDFEKRRKELDRKAKKEAKAEEKLRRKQEEAAGRPGEPEPDAGSPDEETPRPE